MSKASNITATTAATILEMFAGQTVAHDDVAAQIEMSYAASRRRATYGSYVAIDTALRCAGVGSKFSGPNYSGDHFYVFPTN